MFLITFTAQLLSILGGSLSQAVSCHPPVVFGAQCKRHVPKAYSENKKGAGDIPSFLLGTPIGTLRICLVTCVKGLLVLIRCYKVFWHTCSEAL